MHIRLTTIVLILLKDRVTEQVDKILKRTPLTFKPRKVPTNIDEEDPALNETSLPSPLKPEVSLVCSVIILPRLSRLQIMIM